jgi:hypothetical protein
MKNDLLDQLSAASGQDVWAVGFNYSHSFVWPVAFK